MSSFFDGLARWMTTSSSIIGAAIGTPAVAGALAGAVSWQQAILPLIGAAIAIALPQQTGVPIPVPVPVPVAPNLLQAGLDLAGTTAQAVALANPAAGAVIGAATKAVPSLMEALAQAAVDFDKAQATYTALRDQAAAQAQALAAAAEPPTPQATGSTYTPGT